MGHQTINWEKIRADFPILNRKVKNQPLVYFDNAASSQKPQQVIDEIVRYYTTYNANVHRGVHTLSQEGTEAFEATRVAIKDFINASKIEEVIFTKGTTDSINTVAYTFGRAFINEGDEILISGLEHHSNIVPWQMLCEEKKAILKVIPITTSGEWDLTAFDQLLTSKVKLVAVSHVSNALGTVNPVKYVIDKAHALNIPVLLDGAQAAPHQKIDVQALDCDFYCFSGHKMCASTGTGILYGKEKWLNAMPPFEGGGEMIKTVSFEKTVFNELPFKFEAGTPHIEGFVTYKTAVDYLSAIGMENIAAREEELRQYLVQEMQPIEGIQYIGTAKEKAAVVSFLVEGTHPYDVGVLLDQQGVAVRTGHHCTQPIMDFFGIPGTIRASLAFYNNEEDIQLFIKALKRAVSMLR